MALDRSAFGDIHDSIELATSVVQGTRYKKELEKWNKPKSAGGYNANGYEEYPMMLYKAQKVNGKNICMDVEPQPDQFATDDQWRRATERVTRMNRENQRIVGNAEEMEAARRDGWRENPLAAVAFLNGLDDDISRAAAHRHYEDRNMSEKAKAEIAVAEEAADGSHLPEVIQKAKRRGRPRKTAA